MTTVPHSLRLDKMNLSKKEILNAASSFEEGAHYQLIVGFLKYVNDTVVKRKGGSINVGGAVAGRLLKYEDGRRLVLTSTARGGFDIRVTQSDGTSELLEDLEDQKLQRLIRQLGHIDDKEKEKIWKEVERIERKD